MCYASVFYLLCCVFSMNAHPLFALRVAIVASGAVQEHSQANTHGFDECDALLSFFD